MNPPQVYMCSPKALITRKTLFWQLCVVMDVNQTSYSDHFAVYTNNKSLCCVPETNTISYFNYTSIKKRESEHSFQEALKILSRRMDIGRSGKAWLRSDMRGKRERIACSEIAIRSLWLKRTDGESGRNIRCLLPGLLRQLPDEFHCFNFCFFPNPMG